MILFHPSVGGRRVDVPVKPTLEETLAGVEAAVREQFKLPLCPTYGDDIEIVRGKLSEAYVFAVRAMAGQPENRL